MLLDLTRDDLPLARLQKDHPGNFADGSRDTGLIDGPEPKRSCYLTNGGARSHNVQVVVDMGYYLMVKHDIPWRVPRRVVASDAALRAASSYYSRPLRHWQQGEPSSLLR
jgi:hypothetical protein